MVSEKFGEGFGRFLKAIPIRKVISTKKLTLEMKKEQVKDKFEVWAKTLQ